MTKSEKSTCLSCPLACKSCTIRPIRFLIRRTKKQTNIFNHRVNLTRVINNYAARTELSYEDSRVFSRYLDWSSRHYPFQTLGVMRGFLSFTPHSSFSNLINNKYENNHN